MALSEQLHWQRQSECIVRRYCNLLLTGQLARFSSSVTCTRTSMKARTQSKGCSTKGVVKMFVYMYLVPVTRKLVWEWDLIIPISVTWSSCMVSWLSTLVPSSPVHARVFAPVASTRSYWILLLPHQVLFAMYGMHQKKWHTFVETTSIILPLCRYKRNSGRHKCSSRRSASEAAPRFGNLCVYEPSALRIYVYESIALWNKPSDLWQVHVQVHVQENIPNVSVIFFLMCIVCARACLLELADMTAFLLLK